DACSAMVGKTAPYFIKWRGMPRCYVSGAWSAMVGKTAPYFIKFINGLAFSAQLSAASPAQTQRKGLDKTEAANCG
ncbi:MAG: hypothetical protein Q8O86_07980, partial [Dehalococcoidia bacterium]|nr:hypothetical protein [Dehalococcoidia bacterium]